MFAAVSLMAGAQAAQACTEPALGDLSARAQEDKLVRFELSGLTPGSEYLLKVNGRERKSGVATSDKVSRRFRMPHMGDDQRRVTVSVVIANDGCENSPWKLEEKMTYRPEPQPQAEQPKAQPAPSPAPSPTPAPDPAPSPPSAPSPPPAPSITDTPRSQPDVPAPTVKPTVPTPRVPSATEPEEDAKTWLNPLDPYARGENRPPKVNKASIARTELPSENANSTAALLGLAGIFLLLVGVAAIGWTRFRRYDDERLAEILNPEGKLPTHLDPKASDVVAGEALDQRKGLKRLWVFGFLRRRRKIDFDALTRPGPKLTEEEMATLPPEELEKLKEERRRRNKIAARRRRKSVLPTSDPTAPAQDGVSAAGAAGAVAAAGAAAATAGASHEPKKKRRFGLPRRKPKIDFDALTRPGPKLTEEEMATLPPEELEKLKEERRRRNKIAARRRRKSVLPHIDPTAPQPQPQPEQANGKPAPEVVPPVSPPQTNGVPQPPAAHPAQSPAAPPAQPPAANGHPPQPSYRDQVEGELQRILNDAGLHAEVDGILSEAKAEAERQGVPIDSDLILRALCDETNGAATLSDSTRGELESRFKRIVAEERGEQRG